MKILHLLFWRRASDSVVDHSSDKILDNGSINEQTDTLSLFPVF